MSKQYMRIIINENNIRFLQLNLPEESVVKDLAMWITTRIELLHSLTHQPTANKVYKIGCPDPNSKLGWLTEIHFWLTRLNIFEKYLLKEIKEIQNNELSRINFGFKSYFRKQCTFLVYEVMYSV